VLALLEEEDTWALERNHRDRIPLFYMLADGAHEGVLATIAKIRSIDSNFLVLPDDKGNTILFFLALRKDTTLFEMYEVLHAILLAMPVANRRGFIEHSNNAGMTAYDIASEAKNRNLMILLSFFLNELDILQLVARGKYPPDSETLYKFGLKLPSLSYRTTEDDIFEKWKNRWNAKYRLTKEEKQMLDQIAILMSNRQQVELWERGQHTGGGGGYEAARSRLKQAWKHYNRVRR
jgi:hypothetical protein